MRFTESAARLAGAAGVLFGWRPDEFWRATPAELAVLMQALGGDAPEGMGRDDIARLQERFPDG